MSLIPLMIIVRLLVNRVVGRANISPSEECSLVWAKRQDARARERNSVREQPKRPVSFSELLSMWEEKRLRTATTAGTTARTCGVALYFKATAIFSGFFYGLLATRRVGPTLSARFKSAILTGARGRQILSFEREREGEKETRRSKFSL